MTARLTEVQKQRFQEAIKAAAEHAREAINSEDKHDASKHWRKQLGGRFPLVEKAITNGSKSQIAAGLAAFHGRTNPPKPWGWI